MYVSISREWERKEKRKSERGRAMYECVYMHKCVDINARLRVSSFHAQKRRARDFIREYREIRW